jgi:putative addiction module antidote
MTTTLKLTAVGTSTGLVIPKELLTRMKVQKGDVLHAIETRDGILLTPYDAEVEEQIACGERFMDRYRETFRKLAE